MTGDKFNFEFHFDDPTIFVEYDDEKLMADFETLETLDAYFNKTFPHGWIKCMTAYGTNGIIFKDHPDAKDAIMIFKLTYS
jgi:hypothetical protein